MHLECHTCHGTFDDVDAAGLRYFHACPPIVDPQTGATSARPNARDENVDRAKIAARQAVGRTRTSDQHDPELMRAAGAGVAVVRGL